MGSIGQWLLSWCQGTSMLSPGNLQRILGSGTSSPPPGGEEAEARGVEELGGRGQEVGVLCQAFRKVEIGSSLNI